MGWASAGQIFDPIAKLVIETVESDYMHRAVGVKLLETLARQLSEGDWDTWHESLDEFKDHPLVVEAFRAAGLEPDCEVWKGDHSDCHRLAPCQLIKP